MLRHQALVAAALLTCLLACDSSVRRARADLSSPDPEKRIAAAKVVAQAGDNEAVPGLVRLLEDSVPEVRRAAARALGEIGDARAVGPLARIFALDLVPEVARATVRALVLIGPASADTLLDLTRNRKTLVRAGATRALGKLRVAKAVDPLIRLLSDAEPEVRSAAVYGLRQIGDSRGIEAVARLVETDDGKMVDEASEALGGEGYKEQLRRARKLARVVPQLYGP